VSVNSGMNIKKATNRHTDSINALSPLFCEQKINNYVSNKYLSCSCLRVESRVGLQPGLQLARIMECGLNRLTQHGCYGKKQQKLL